MDAFDGAGRNYRQPGYRTITRRQSWVEGALESADPDLDRLLAGPMLEGVPELSSRA
jgi:hypothetical protein